MTDLKKIAAEMRDHAVITGKYGNEVLQRIIESWADALDALAAQSQDRLEYLLNLCRARHGVMSNAQIIAETECVFAAPQPAAPQSEPATMIETIPVDETHELRKIDGFWQLFAVREGTWVRSLNGYECEFVDCAIRSAAIQTAARLAAPQRMTVSREALLDGLNALDSSCKLWHIGEIETVLRALGIEVKE